MRALGHFCRVATVGHRRPLAASRTALRTAGSTARNTLTSRRVIADAAVDPASEASFQRALVDMRDERWAAAVTLLDGVIRHNPADQRAYAARASCLEQLERLPEAEADLRRVVALVPQSPPAYVALAETLRKAGKCDEALRLMDTLLHGGGAYGPALVLKGQLHAQLRQADAAVSAFDAALKLDENDEFALAGLADMHMHNGRLKEAEVLFVRVWIDVSCWCGVDGRGR